MATNAPHHPMFEHIRQSNLIENITSSKEVNQSLKAWDYLAKQKKLSHTIVREVQRLITANQEDLAPEQKGHYRTLTKVNVKVGNYVAPHYLDVPNLMEEWLDQPKQPKHATYTPWENHVLFESIHPFVDGNGRTGRMLMWWEETINPDLDTPVTPTMFWADQRFAYYHDLESFRTRTITQMKKIKRK